MNNIVKLTSTNNITLNQIKGCLIGALLGDCIGHKFEFEDDCSKEEIDDYFEHLQNPNEKASSILKYTDDTAMLKSVAESLIKNLGFDANDMAKHFITEYFNAPDRGYGQHVGDVFRKIKEQKSSKDVFKPASEQFNGSGSYGNGGAMRVAPVGVFCCNNYEQLLNIATLTTKITHTNYLAIHGAILQAIAVRQSLLHDKTNPIDAKEFLTELKNEMRDIEKDNSEDCKSYVKKLEAIEEHLELCKDEKLNEETEQLNNQQIVEILGNGVAAYDSVPTAIYSFLRSLKPIPGINTDNVISRTIHYAIVLGGDTDTIASMAGAIAGAYYGYDYVDTNLTRWVELHDYIVELAEQLYDATEKHSVNSEKHSVNSSDSKEEE